MAKLTAEEVEAELHRRWADIPRWVYQIGRAWPWTDFDEVVAQARLETWRALRKWDPELSAHPKLAPWLIQRVRRRTIDHLRTQGGRRLGSTGVQSAEWVANHNRVDTEPELVMMLHGEAEHGYQRVEDRELVAQALAIIATWPARKRSAVLTQLHDTEGMTGHPSTLRSVGESYGVSEARMSQIRTAALKELRRALDPER